jgi:hypothetical protein
MALPRKEKHMTILGELGIDVGRPDVVEVHNIIRG